MANILVIYGTVEGQSRKIAEFIGDHLSRRRNQVRVIDAAKPGKVAPPAFDAAIMVASVHMARHSAAAREFAGRHSDVLNAMPAAFVSVSMNAISEHADDREEAEGYITQFADETGFRPRAALSAAGALRFTRYDYFKGWIIKRMAAEKGVKPDAAGDLEFTDWNALTVFIDGFLRDHVPGG
ncbi:MAG: hypothetical protein KIS81_01600 [Maricaulaceae bacterium]|nr:hypothetical protein [Maricaulaceae bacterium]